MYGKINFYVSVPGVSEPFARVLCTGLVTIQTETHWYHWKSPEEGYQNGTEYGDASGV